MQILIELKSRDIVKSVRGKEGGYLLGRPPEAITLGDILRCFHGQIFELPEEEESGRNSELRAAWKRMQTTLEKEADAITFQSLLDQAGDKERMFYI